MKKKPPIVFIKKSRKIPQIEVVFTPEVEMKIVRCPKSYAKGAEPSPTVKRKSKIKYEQSWRL